MKIFKLFYIIIVMCFTATCAAEVQYKDDIYKGKVKSVKYSYFKAKGKLGSSLEKTIDNIPTFAFFFNKQGEISERWLYVQGDLLASKEIYQYDKDNRLSKVLVLGGNDELVIEKRYKYNSLNRLIEKSKYEYEKLTDKSKYEYDEYGNQTKELVYFYIFNKKEQFDTGHTIYKYKNKKKREELIYSKDDTLEYKAEYDDKGNRIKLYVYNEDGSLKFSHLYFYNNDSQLVKEETTYERNGAHTVQLNKYDEYGNMIESATFKPKNTLFSKNIFVYQYDKQGNWISKTTYLDGNASSVRERKIEYYN